MGFIIGRLNTLSGQTYSGEKGKNKSIKKHQEISIDAKTYVTEMKTDQLEKSFTGLGNTTVDKDTVSSSVSKLNQLKKG